MSPVQRAWFWGRVADGNPAGSALTSTGLILQAVNTSCLELPAPLAVQLHSAVLYAWMVPSSQTQMHLLPAFKGEVFFCSESPRTAGSGPSGLAGSTVSPVNTI